MSQSIFDVSKIELFFFFPKDVSKKYVNKYHTAYHCWKKVWKVAFDEMKVKETLYSDVFYSSDEVLTIFYEDKCVGTVLCDWLDLGDHVVIDRSYFQVWPELVLRKIVDNYGANIMVCSYLAVDFEFRKRAYGLSWKDLLIASTVKRFIQSDVDAMIATPRIKKKSEILTNRNGAETLLKNIEYKIENEPIDLIVWRKDCNFNKQDDDLMEVVNEIWDRVVYLGNMPFADDHKIAV